MVGSSLAIFNYQKSSSPVIASILYSLRTSPLAREHLGDEVYFLHRIPIIWGEMNQMHGRIDISFSVRGSRGTGVMKFASFRPTSRGVFETHEWSLEMENGERVDLLAVSDPWKGLDLETVGVFDDDDEDVPVTRGFRKL